MAIPEKSWLYPRKTRVVSQLLSDYIVEVSARITRNGAEALEFGPMEPAVRGMVHLMKTMEEALSTLH